MPMQMPQLAPGLHAADGPGGDGQGPPDGLRAAAGEGGSDRERDAIKERRKREKANKKKNRKKK